MTLRYNVAAGIATITLDRPERKNAFTMGMLDAWVTALASAAADAEVRVVVLTGAGDAFCSGIDLAGLEQETATPLGLKQLLMQRIHRVALMLEDLDKPVIGSINGAAVGAGLDMALHCDVRVAGASARLSEGYIKVGLVPGDGGAWLLPRLVGPAVAMELLLTGRMVGSEEALRLGLVNHVVPDEDLAATTAELAGSFAAAPPVQVAMIRRLVRQAERIDLRTHFDLVSSHAGVVGSLEDYHEAMRAFRERRPGTYLGR